MDRETAINECKKSFNHIGIYGGYLLCRLIGFYDGDNDFYYILKTQDAELVYGSMCIGFFSLQKMSNSAYNYINNIQILNDCSEAKEFMERVD